MTTPPTPRLEITGITKRFGPLVANRDIDLRIEAGQVVGILGENGAGKSTLMKILSGYQPPDAGVIRVDGQPLSIHSPQDAIRAGIGMLHQDPLDVGAFSVLEEFMYGLDGGPLLNRRAGRARLSEVCQRLGFALPPDVPVASLSIAARQQLAIARLLALGVRVLILDEPTTGISADQKEALFGALRRLADQDGLTVLLVSHKLEDVRALCDSVAVLRRGELVGTAQMPVSQAGLVELMFGQPIEVLRHETRVLPDAAPVLRMDGLTVGDARLTVQDFSLAVRAGEVIGFAGLDGSGQALIMRAAAGLMRPRAGVIHIDGRAMTGRSYRQFMASGVFFGAAGRLEEGLVRGLTLTEHIALATERRPLIDWGRARARTRAQIERYRVKGTPDSPIETLSGGNQQRVLMALMAEHPRLMVLEQPTRGLDVHSSRWIWSLLLERRDSGAALLFSSDDLDEILTYADRIVVCFAGQTRLIDNTDALDSATLGHLIGGGLATVPQ